MLTDIEQSSERLSHPESKLFRGETQQLRKRNDGKERHYEDDRVVHLGEV